MSRQESRQRMESVLPIGAPRGRGMCMRVGSALDGSGGAQQAGWGGLTGGGETRGGVLGARAAAAMLSGVGL